MWEQSATEVALRPSTWPNGPRPSTASTKPMCQASATSSHFPVVGFCFHTGLPRRVSSIPIASAAGGCPGSTWAA